MSVGTRVSGDPSYGDSLPADPASAIRAATHNGLRGDGERFMGALLGLLHSPDPSVRSAAATALGVIGDERVIPSLRSAADDPETSVTVAAALARARLGDESAPQEACESLSGQLRDGDSEQRQFAARALGALGLHDAYGPLVDALSDRESDVRHDAADALGRLGDAHAAEVLGRVGSEDPVERVRNVALGALARLSAAAD